MGDGSWSAARDAIGINDQRAERSDNGRRRRTAELINLLKCHI